MHGRILWSLTNQAPYIATQYEPLMARREKGSALSAWLLFGKRYDRRMRALSLVGSTVFSTAMHYRVADARRECRALLFDRVYRRRRARCRAPPRPWERACVCRAA